MNTIPLLSLLIEDTCNRFEPVDDIEQADSIITLDELQLVLLDALKNKIPYSEQKNITTELLKQELAKNNFYSTTIISGESENDVWLVKIKPGIS